ncbi:MAG: PAS domain S-box protein [Phycisphaerae bacterium]
MVVAADITERKQAGATPALLSNALQAAANGVVIADRAGTILWVNKAFTRLTGYSFEEAVGRNPRLLKSGRQDEAFYRNLWETIASGRVWHGEIINRRKDGTLYTEEMTITPVQSETGKITHFINIKQDITDRKRGEHALRESEERHRVLFESSRDALMTLAPPAWTFTSCNPATLKMFEVKDAAAFTSLSPADLSPEFQPDGRASAEKAREMIETAMSEGSCTFEWAHKRLNGEVFPAEVVLMRLTLEDRTLLQARVRDLTAQKEAEHTLKESEERFRAVVTAARDAIVMMGPDGAITLWSPSAETLFGWTAQEAVGQPLHNLLAPERLREAHARAFPAFQATGSGAAVGKTLELPALRKDGHEILVELSLSPLRLEGQWYALGILRDATERKQTEQALQRALLQTKQILASISSLLIGVDEHDLVIQWNAVAESIFSIRAADVLGRPFRECGIPWDWAPVLEAIAATRAAGQQRRVDDLRYTRPDGRSGFLGICVNPIPSEEGGLSGLLLIGADITERKALQTQLNQAQKLESIGSLAAGIAHEINTPTQFVGDNVRFLRDAFQDLRGVLDASARLLDACRQGTVTPGLVAEVEAAVRAADLEYLSGEIPKAIEQSLEGVNRVAKIVRAMKDFSHPGSEDKKTTDLNKAIETTITVARNEWKYVAELTTEFDPDLPPVPCLPGEINQVILNLIINAAHAIADVVGDGSKGKGLITVSTHRDGDWAEIRVRDTGTGIPEAIRGRVFDPFFTTKAVGKGTGQGLAIAHSVIVNKHGGSITFETEVGKGTTFILRLPIRPSPVEKPEERAE